MFGDSGTKSALYRVDLPVQIGGCVHFLRTHVVSGETPLLIGRRSMARMRMRIDAANNTVTVNLGAGDFTIRCDVSCPDIWCYFFGTHRIVRRCD